MSATLKPCPFCNTSGEELMIFCDPEEGRDNSGPSRRIQCAGCHVEAPFYPTEADAIAAWNRRADGWMPEHIERLKDAVEGECDGLAIDDAQATSILRFVCGEDDAPEPTS